MDGSSTSSRPLLSSASGRRILMNAVEFGQLVAKTRAWVAPTAAGKHSATRHATAVIRRIRPAGAAVMNLSSAYPAAMAVNHAPMSPCLFSEARLCRLACSAGTRTMAAVSSVISHARAVRGWLTQA